MMRCKSLLLIAVAIVKHFPKRTRRLAIRSPPWSTEEVTSAVAVKEAAYLYDIESKIYESISSCKRPLQKTE